MIRTAPTSVRMLQAISLIASITVLLWSLGLPVFNSAEAARVTSVKDTLTDSDISAATDHEIQYVIPSGSAGVEAGETIVVSFPAGFSFGSVGVADIDLEVNGSDVTLAGSPSGATWGVGIAGQDLTFTSGSGTIGANATVTIKIGTNADGGTNQMSNPGTANSYDIDITSGDGANNDSGTAVVAILDNVTVTASVDTVFEFTVSGFATTGIDINGTTTTATSSATEIPFGTLGQNEVVTVGQQLNVLTNANYGFVVTVEQDGDLSSATGAVIDGFADGAYTNTPSDWVSPSAVVGSPATYGHWGITSSDDHDDGNGDFQSCAAALTGGCWVAASTTPREIFSHNSVADNTTDNIGSTTVAYQVEVSALQEAADDYSTTLTYIATPTF